MLAPLLLNIDSIDFSLTVKRVLIASSSVIRQKVKSQNGGNKKTKHVIFSKIRTLPTT